MRRSLLISLTRLTNGARRWLKAQPTLTTLSWRSISRARRSQKRSLSQLSARVQSQWSSLLCFSVLHTRTRAFSRFSTTFAHSFLHLSIQQLSLVQTLTQRKRKTASRLRTSRHQLSRSRSLPTRSWAVWYSSAFTQVR